MRVSSLVIFAALVLTALYFIFLTPDWAKDLYLKATGYGPAATPTEAVDKFLKAVKARDMNTAARFVTADYAAQLKRAATATKEMGPVLDGIFEYMTNKGLATNKSVTYLHFLDPFPTNLSMAAAPKEIDAAKARGFIAVDAKIWPDAAGAAFGPGGPAELGQFDPRMFNRVLMPLAIHDPRGIEIVKEGEEWKLNPALAPGQVQFIDHYLNNYKAYHTRLSTFRRDMTNDRYDSKQKFESELVTAIQESK
ncbi:MAG: hypothetical protein L0Y71_05775 [Gemmataceae bacterium]|nr:hypothetical protein [Gemmataceae bacterium]